MSSIAASRTSLTARVAVRRCLLKLEIEGRAIHRGDRGRPRRLLQRSAAGETAKLGHANILISGQTGVGKSTLINAVFSVPLADEGIGKPVTKHVQRYDVPGVPVTIFDTPGIELGKTKNDVIREYKKTITDSRKGVRTT